MIISKLTDPQSISDTVLGEAHSLEYSIFGPAGAREYVREHKLSDFEPAYGNYILITRVGSRIRIRTDHFGLHRLYVYRHDDFWAVSDSIHDLAETARENGYPLTAYTPAAYGFCLRYGMGLQLSSFRTPVSQIQLLPHWQDIIIDGAELRLERQQDVVWSADLHQAIHQAGHFFASLLKSYLDHGSEPVIRMSAGLDSRCTLAAMLSISDNSILEKVGLYTSEADRHAEEKRIVLDLLKKLPFHYCKQPMTKRGDSWTGWKRRFLGGQAQVASYPAYGLPQPIFTGASGEVAREFYDWDGNTETLEFLRPIPSEPKALLLADIEAAISSFNAQGADLLTNENKHYQMFRNRFHFGRSTTESIFRFPPLIYSLLNLGTGRGDTEPLHRIIYELGGEDLLLHPYDSPQKSFNKLIPQDWKRIKFSASDLRERRLFRGHAGSVGGSGDHREFVPGDLNWKRGQLISDDFVLDAQVAIERISTSGLLDKDMMRSARIQLDKLRKGKNRILPSYYPGLMATMALHMAT